MSFFGIPMRNGLSLGLGTVASLTNGPGFLPDELFYGGTVQGAWYDPSDLTTLFQDSAGTTPVTAVEQAVGLMLDKSKGLVLGSEILVNGDFSNGTTNWGSFQSTISASSGGVLLTQAVAAGAGQLSYTGSTSAMAGNWVKASFRFSNRTGAQPVRLVIFNITAGFTVVVLGSSSASSGTITCYGFCPSGSTYQVTADLFQSAIGDSVLIDDFTVKTIAGNHAYQTTSASRPTLRARYNQLLYTEDFSNALWVTSVGGTGVSATKTPNFGIAPDGTQTACRVQLNKGAGATDNDFARMFQSSTVSNSVRKIWIRTNDNSTKTFRLAAGGGNITVTGTWSQVSDAASSSSLQVLLQGTTSADADFLVWHPEVVQNSAVNLPYQRIGAATDYATGAAFPPYLFFDGTDDSMLTNSVDFATVTSDGQARRNLLLNPTQFDAAGWTKGNCTITANNAVAPDGTNTADTVLVGASTAITGFYQGLTATAAAHTISVYVKQAITVRYMQLLWTSSVLSSNFANFDLQTGTVTAGTYTSATITAIGNGWYRLTMTSTLASSPGDGPWITAVSSGSAGRAGTYVGNSTDTFLVWGAQLETGSTATAFQNIGTDKMLVVAGVTKNSDATGGRVAELSADGETNNGAFGLWAPSTATTASLAYVVRGTTTRYVEYTNAAIAAPVTSVLTGQSNIGAPSASLRVNGAQVAASVLTQGTGNYGNYPLYIGRRNNASLPFNGNIYSLIIAGQSYSSGQISSTESWVAAKTPLGTI